MLNIISLGAGVQSSTMALMAAMGQLKPMPDCAIFADTGAEPKHVYDFLDYVESLVPFPVYRVMEGEGLEHNVLTALKNDDGKDEKGNYAAVPFFCEPVKGNSGMLRRQCTTHYKIKPIQEKIRELLGLAKGQRGPKEVAVQQWIGISMDESVRMKINPTKWINNRWPLIDNEMYRYDCIRWMRAMGFREPKKSACYFCPYSSDQTWMDLRANDPDSWNKAIQMDAFIRPGATGKKLYLHRSMQPLNEIDFDPARDQFDMFDHECEGMCGV